MQLRKISLLAIAAIFTYSASIAQTNNNLNLKKGQKYLLENKTSTFSTTEVQGQPMEVTVEATTSYHIEVSDNNDKGYTLTNTVKNVKMEMSQMGQEISFDSDKKEDLDGPIGSAMKDYINVPQKVTIGNDGKIIKDAAKVSDKATSPFGDFETGGFGAAMAFQAVPKDLKVGQTWKNSSNENGTVRNTTYTVKAINGNLATLSLAGDMDVNAKMEQMGMEMTTKAKGTFTGEEVVDIKTGVVQSQNMVINSDGNIEVMGQELPTSSKVTSITTIKAI